MHAHVIRGFGRHVLADEVGADRKFAVAAIDEDGEPDRARPSVVDERVHGRTDRPTGEQDVIDEHDDLLVDREIQRRLVDDRRVSDARQVVAIERDVERAQRDDRVLVRADRVAQPRRQNVAARADADDGQIGEVSVALDDLMRDPRNGATNVVGAKQHGQIATPSRPHRTGR
jgi:hypothetical protein